MYLHYAHVLWNGLRDSIKPSRVMGDASICSSPPFHYVTWKKPLQFRFQIVGDFSFCSLWFEKKINNFYFLPNLVVIYFISFTKFTSGSAQLLLANVTRRNESKEKWQLSVKSITFLVASNWNIWTSSFIHSLFQIGKCVYLYSTWETYSRAIPLAYWMAKLYCLTGFEWASLCWCVTQFNT